MERQRWGNPPLKGTPGTPYGFPTEHSPTRRERQRRRGTVFRDSNGGGPYTCKAGANCFKDFAGRIFAGYGSNQERHQHGGHAEHGGNSTSFAEASLRR